MQNNKKKLNFPKAGDAEDYERLLRKFRYFLHENHYWVLDVKRRLIDIYGNKPGHELYKLPKVSTQCNYNKAKSKFHFRFNSLN